MQFADDLIAGQGQHIVQGWQALAGKEPQVMRVTADKLEAKANGKLTSGHLKGLLFGDAGRFIRDLAMQLRLRAAYEEFAAASQGRQNVKVSFEHFVAAADAWQQQTGYECEWSWPNLRDTLRTLKSPAIDAVLDEKGQGSTPFERLADYLRKSETYTLRLIAAMKKTEQSF